MVERGRSPLRHFPLITQDSYLIEQQSQKIAELERHISQITQQSQKKDSQISEAISQAEEWKARADQEQTRAKDQERKLLEEQLNLKKTLQKKGLQASEAISQAEEWKNQAEKSEIQIQKLLSEKLFLLVQILRCCSLLYIFAYALPFGFKACRLLGSFSDSAVKLSALGFIFPFNARYRSQKRDMVKGKVSYADGKATLDNIPVLTFR